jgi:hypothetical protein
MAGYKHIADNFTHTYTTSMAMLVQTPFSLVVSFTTVPWRTDSPSSRDLSSSSLAKPVRPVRGPRIIADNNPPRAILHGRPSVAQEEDLPPYSLDTDLPVYTTLDEESHPVPALSPVPKYMSIFVFCMLHLLPLTGVILTQARVVFRRSGASSRIPFARSRRRARHAVEV